MYIKIIFTLRCPFHLSKARTAKSMSSLVCPTEIQVQIMSLFLGGIEYYNKQLFPAYALQTYEQFGDCKA